MAIVDATCAEPESLADTVDERAGATAAPEFDLAVLRARLRRSPYQRVIKPALDRVVAAAVLITVSPLMFVIAAAIKLKLGRPVLIVQQRVGLDGQPFSMYKFRTMLPDRRVADRPVAAEQRVCHKSANDPRHTTLGRFLRGTSLDELPQLWNIVRGEMALVGPRPELVDIVRRYEPWQHARHLVRPGLTGLWQISGRADGELMHLHTEVDIEYVRMASFATDRRLMIDTVRMMLRGRLQGS